MPSFKTNRSCVSGRLKHAELLLDLTGTNYTSSFLYLEHVEGNSFCETAALANGEHVTFLDAEGGRSVRGNVGMTLFEPSELGNEVKVVTANDNGALHSSGEAYTLKDTATDGNLAGEGALLVNVGALDCFLGRLEAKANILVETSLATTGRLLG